MKIYFCLKRISDVALPGDAIQVYPRFSTWNDFGHQSQFLFLIPGEMDARDCRFAFADEGANSTKADNAADLIKAGLIQHEAEFLPAEEFPPFFTMLHEMEEYRSLTSKFGIADGNKILKSLNDLVYIRSNHLFIPELVTALSSRVFNLSFLRNSESIFAFYNAGSVLAGVQNENLDFADTEIHIEFQLASFKNSHNLSFTFDRKGIIPRQIAVIIGKNGTGKSRTLYKIAEAALSKAEHLKGKNGGSPLISKIIAISTPGETTNSFPDIPSEPKIRYERLIPDFSEKAGFGNLTLSEMFIQLAKVWDKHIGVSDRWKIFTDLISGYINISELAIGTPEHQNSGGKEPPVHVQRLHRGGEQKTLEAMQRLHKRGVLLREINGDFYPLSSGQVSFIRLAAQLTTTIENGSLILIDEPETHLHPNLITEFVEMLNKVLEATGSIAIVATHSSYLVREVPRTQVHILRERDGILDVSLPRLKTFGADVGAISEFVFGDDIVNRLVEDVKHRLQNNPTLRMNWKNELKDELSTEAIMYLDAYFENESNAL